MSVAEAKLLLKVDFPLPGFPKNDSSSKLVLTSLERAFILS